MRLLDPKFRENMLRYILQCFGVTVLIYIIIQIINVTLDTTLIASFAATTFIIFTMPHKNVSNPRYIIGSYTIGLLIGIIAYFIHSDLNWLSIELVSALTVGLSIFAMVITNTEHPPAAACAFAIVNNGFHIKTIIIIYFVTISFSLIKHYTKRWLIDLL